MPSPHASCQSQSYVYRLSSWRDAVRNVTWLDVEEVKSLMKRNHFLPFFLWSIYDRYGKGRRLARLQPLTVLLSCRRIKLTAENTSSCSKRSLCSRTYVIDVGLRQTLFYLCSVHSEIYTGCNRRDGPDFGRVFLRSNYTDITQNTYIQSWTVTEILAREKSGLLWCLRTVLVGDIILAPTWTEFLCYH